MAVLTEMQMAANSADLKGSQRVARWVDWMVHWKADLTALMWVVQKAVP